VTRIFGYTLVIVGGVLTVVIGTALLLVSLLYVALIVATVTPLAIAFMTLVPGFFCVAYGGHLLGDNDLESLWSFRKTDGGPDASGNSIMV
jgi:hypothetical protein